MRIFFDTNVLLSAYLTRGLCADLLRFVLTRHELLTGEVNLAELRKVLKEKFHATSEQIEDVESELREQSIIPRPSVPFDLKIRDPDDGWVLASAIKGEANMLVTGDRDLLDIVKLSPIPIVDPRGCWELLRDPQAGP